MGRYRTELRARRHRAMRMKRRTCEKGTRRPVCPPHPTPMITGEGWRRSNRVAHPPSRLTERMYAATSVNVAVLVCSFICNVLDFRDVVISCSAGS